MRRTLIAVLCVASFGCTTMQKINPFHKADPVVEAGNPSDVGDARAEQLVNTDTWFKTIETVRIAVKAAKQFADAAATAGKISDVERKAVYAIAENVKAALKVANAELTLYFQDSTTEASVVAKISEVNRSSKQLDVFVSGLKSRQIYDAAGEDPK